MWLPVILLLDHKLLEARAAMVSAFGQHVARLKLAIFKIPPKIPGKQLLSMPTGVRAAGNSVVKPARLTGNWPDGISCKLKGLIIWGSCLESRRDECNIQFLVTTVCQCWERRNSPGFNSSHLHSLWGHNTFFYEAHKTKKNLSFSLKLYM